ncbi:hypothetical protein ACCO45_002412 [Purpureocillium lilacinum]|uniref:Uncharacterized protein n=1 Tax=Purpureocillium lilacinum TaxID=33203 RepID=A0ACC4EC86_PURLI
MAAEGFRLCRPASAVATLWPGARLHAAQHASASGGWPLAGTRARCDDSAADDMRARIQQPESRDNSFVGVIFTGRAVVDDTPRRRTTTNKEKLESFKPPVSPALGRTDCTETTEKSCARLTGQGAPPRSVGREGVWHATADLPQKTGPRRGGSGHGAERDDGRWDPLEWGGRDDSGARQVAASARNLRCGGLELTTGRTESGVAIQHASRVFAGPAGQPGNATTTLVTHQPITASSEPKLFRVEPVMANNARTSWLTPPVHRCGCSLVLSRQPPTANGWVSEE